eukprot:9433427-Ditylum_brightwellii.AAC.1
MAPSGTNQQFYMVLKYAKDRDLLVLINQAKKQNKYLKESQVWLLFLPLVGIAAYMYKKSITQHNFKTLNIFLTLKMEVKARDFGM